MVVNDIPKENESFAIDNYSNRLRHRLRKTVLIGLSFIIIVFGYICPIWSIWTAISYIMRWQSIYASLNCTVPCPFFQWRTQADPKILCEIYHNAPKYWAVFKQPETVFCLRCVELRKHLFLSMLQEWPHNGGCWQELYTPYKKITLISVWQHWRYTILELVWRTLWFFFVEYNWGWFTHK